MDGENAIHPLNVDLRPEIQHAYVGCWDDIIDYNCVCATQGEAYGGMFKIGFYRKFQKIHFLSRHVFDDKRVGDSKEAKELNQLLNSIEAWILKIKNMESPGKKEIEDGHSFFVKMEPHLSKMNLIAVNKDLISN